MQFIRIITQDAHPAFFNMALDEAISEAVRQKLSPPTLRLYQWDNPSVTIGYFQKISDVDIDYCNKKSYPVVRRATGGRAVLHDSGLTYSFSSHRDFAPFNGSLLENYRVLSGALVRGLKQTGIDAEISFEKKRREDSRNPSCFKSMSYGEITVDGRKVVGSAQKRYQNGFMQQGSVMLNSLAGELRNVLGGREEGFREIGPINTDEKRISCHDLGRSMKDAFEKELGVKLISDNPAKFELDLAKELEAKKYSTKEWNFRR
ncbi:MAG: lipoate--protein ligase family protein [Nitrospiraceae bacterium]|nr:MAG: lipoate--protein ligase family protein [Nitrospiraceae bacterium]